MARGPNAGALLATLHSRGVKVTEPGELAALVQLARQLAGELDAGEPSASMYQAYLSVLRQLLEATATKEESGDSPAEALRRLRSV